MDKERNYTFQQNAKEAEAMADHAYYHKGTEFEHWCDEDCAFCEANIDGEIEAGIRCRHGELIPNVKDQYGTIGTDLECPKCEMEIDQSIAVDIAFSKHKI